jgi:predicted phosphate transport protein (TIGR00153 family)
MAKNDKFYFENFVSCAALAKEASTFLVNCLENYHPENIEQMLEDMHNIEHTADMKKHEMSEALAKAFVTPVDREDLDMLSQKMDDLIDMIEEILQKFYIYDIQSIEPAAIEFTKYIVRSCELLCELMKEFENFKKSKNIYALIIELNDVEEECDKLYLASMRALTQNTTDVLRTISWRKIYESLEACSDACEHVSECVGSVIMKNT